MRCVRTTSRGEKVSSLQKWGQVHIAVKMVGPVGLSHKMPQKPQAAYHAKFAQSVVMQKFSGNLKMKKTCVSYFIFVY